MSLTSQRQREHPSHGSTFRSNVSHRRMRSIDRRVRPVGKSRHLGSGRRTLHQRGAEHAGQWRLGRSAAQRRRGPLDQAAADVLGDCLQCSTVWSQSLGGTPADRFRVSAVRNADLAAGTTTGARRRASCRAGLRDDADAGAGVAADYDRFRAGCVRDAGNHGLRRRYFLVRPSDDSVGGWSCGPPLGSPS